jgi:hypothetical protein
MKGIQFVQKNAQGLDEVRISETKGIEAPFFTPELKGPEGLKGLLAARSALDPQNPIMVPGHRWQGIRSKPQFKKVRVEIHDLVSNHPVFYYEPVELFRYTLPQTLVTYAFQGDRTQSSDFYTELRDQNPQAAINLLPTFFQPFVETQMKALCESKDISVPKGFKNQSSGKVHEAWRDTRADSGFTDYFEGVADDASKSPESAVLPPAPPIMKSSGQDAISRTLGFNGYMRTLCESKWNKSSSGSVTSYLHFYVDQGVFEPSNNQNDQRIKQAIRAELNSAAYAGVALTISNYENIWQKGNDKQLERFITDIVSIAQQEQLPVVLPRSGHYGMHLTDCGVQSFSTLMNGNNVYNRRGGWISERAKYGTLPIYGRARDVNAEELDRVLKRNGNSVHSIGGLPSSPPTYNPSGGSYKGKFGNASRFRSEFGKPRRLVHSLEAEELRQAIRRGTADPAQRYLERSDHPDLS